MDVARPLPISPPRRLGRPSPELLAGAVVVLLAAVALGLFTRGAASLPLGRGAALAALRRDPATAAALRGLPRARAELVAIDAGREQVNLIHDGRTVLAAVVRSDGTVQESVLPGTRGTPYGSEIAYRPAVLAGLALLFLLVAGVAPLRRIRNLDAVALVTLVAPVILLQHAYVALSALAGALPLGYLAARCAWIAAGPDRRSTGPAPASSATPLLDLVLAGLGRRERGRLVQIGLGSAALVTAMVTVSSTGPVDVIYAVMEGATGLLHGVLPYGHLPPEIVHGDTYPLLSYAAYVPVAALAPVTSLWDSVDAALAAAALAAFAAAALAGRAARPAAGAGRPGEGARVALALLLFPPGLAIVSSGTTDVALGALVLGAVVLWRRPAAATGVLALAGWFKLAPLILLPAWLAGLRGRRLAAALAALAMVTAATFVPVFALGGSGGISAMTRAIGYQLHRGDFQSLWHALGADGLQPLAEAVLLGAVAAAAVRTYRDPPLLADPRRLAALAAALLIGLELAAGYWSFLYLAWVAPLLIVTLLGAAPSSPSELER